MSVSDHVSKLLQPLGNQLRAKMATISGECVRRCNRNVWRFAQCVSESKQSIEKEQTLFGYKLLYLQKWHQTCLRNGQHLTSECDSQIIEISKDVAEKLSRTLERL